MVPIDRICLVSAASVFRNNSKAYKAFATLYRKEINSKRSCYGIETIDALCSAARNALQQSISPQPDRLI
jgi:hypothetical protein